MMDQEKAGHSQTARQPDQRGGWTVSKVRLAVGRAYTVFIQLLLLLLFLR